MDTSGLALAGLILTAIGWLTRELLRQRSAKRQAARDADNILTQKKGLLEDLISKTQGTVRKEELQTQLDEVNAALLGLYDKRLRVNLKNAGLPTEEILKEDGYNRLKPQQTNSIMQVIDEIKSLPTPISNEILTIIGNAYYYIKQYEDANNIYDRILDLNPDDPYALLNRGVTYGQLGRYDEALADFNRSLELRPNYTPSLTNRGNAYIELGRYDEALADLSHSLELSPHDPVTFCNLGCLYERLERYDEALTNFKRSLEIRPDNHDTLHNLGVTLSKLKRYDEAFTVLNHTLEIEPNNAETLYTIACLFSLWEKADEVLAYLEKAIGKDEKYRKMAKTDKDFDNIREDPHFKKLLEPD